MTLTAAVEGISGAAGMPHVRLWHIAKFEAPEKSVAIGG
jgi:hypothetical protein